MPGDWGSEALSRPSTVGTTTSYRTLIGIPDGVVAHALLPIGWPSDKIGPVNRRPVRKVVSIDSWGTAWDYASGQPDDGLRDRWVQEPR